MSLSRPTVPEVLPFLRDYLARPGNMAGGSLHIVTDDGNYEDDAVRHCLEYADKRGDEPGRWLAALLLRMTKTQRKRVCWKAHYEKP